MVLRTCIALTLLGLVLLAAWGHARTAEHSHEAASGHHDHRHDHPHAHSNDHPHDHAHDYAHYTHDQGHDHDHGHDHGDMHDLMGWVLDPAAGVIWRSAGSITTMEGTEDLAPTTAEGWDRVRHAASVISESGYLLMLPGRARDEDDWKQLSQAMTEIGGHISKAAEQRDAEAIFDLGGELYQACLGCHQLYLIDDLPDLPVQ